MADYLRLVADSGGVGLLLPEVSLELLEGGDREAAAGFDPVKKLAIVHDDGCQARFRHAAPFTKAGRVVQQLFFEGHIPVSLVVAMDNAGTIPHLSTGFFPHAQKGDLRDNSRGMKETLANRIRVRLEATGQSANAASQKAGLDRDYIGDLLKRFDAGETQNPRTDTIAKLAKALTCDGEWLASGRRPPAEDNQIQEALTLLSGLPDDQRENALVVLRALYDRSHPIKTG